MTRPAEGIHNHPTLKLGARTGVLRSNTRALAFRDFLKVAPTHPLADLAPYLVWPMDMNDQAGVCVVAGVDHALQAIHHLLGVERDNWTADQILLYYQTQNPRFRSWADSGGPNDNGMDIQEFLSYLVKQGVILGFAAIDHASEEQVKAAIYLGLAVVTGEDLQQAQQDQAIWDHVAGSPPWGGHATTWVGYPGQPDYDTCVTWGQLVQMTQQFVTLQVTEAYFILTEAHVAHPSFREGFDLAKFGDAYTALTGRPLVLGGDPRPMKLPWWRRLLAWVIALFR